MEYLFFDASPTTLSFRINDSGNRAMAEQANFEFYRGTAVTLRFRLVDPDTTVNYAGWTTEFTVRHEPSSRFTRGEETTNAIMTIAGSIANAVSASRYGIFDVPLSAANTLLLEDRRIYDWAFRRTDANNEDVLAFGEVRAFTVA